MNYQQNAPDIKSNEEIVTLFREIHKTIKRYGVEKIISKLRDIDAENLESNELIEFIFDKASVEFGVSVYEIKKSNKRGTVSEAKRMCILLCSRHLTTTKTALAGIFDRSKTIILRANKQFEQMKQNPTLKQEFNFLERYNRLNDAVSKFKESRENLPQKKTKK